MSIYKDDFNRVHNYILGPFNCQTQVNIRVFPFCLCIFKTSEMMKTIAAEVFCEKILIIFQLQGALVKQKA